MRATIRPAPTAIGILAIVAVLALSMSLSPVLAEAKPAKPDGAWMGIMLGKPGDDFSGLLGDDDVDGVAVRFVVEDSPAAKAGLRARDRITAVGGAPVSSAYDLLGELKAEKPGSWIPMTIARRGDERDIRIRLISRPENTRGLRLRRGMIGVEAIELPSSLRMHFGAPEDAGVMISAVEEASPAEAAGFLLGDVIHEIDGRPVASEGDLRRLIESGGVGNELEFTVARSGVEVMLESTLIARPDDR